jgi:ribosomal protein L7/L12
MKNKNIGYRLYSLVKEILIQENLSGEIKSKAIELLIEASSELNQVFKAGNNTYILNPDQYNFIVALIEKEENMSAIKCFRGYTDCPLIDAKNIIDQIVKDRK